MNARIARLAISVLAVASVTIHRSEAFGFQDKRQKPVGFAPFKPAAPAVEASPLVPADPLAAERGRAARRELDAAYQGIKIGKSTTLKDMPDRFQENIISLLEEVDFVPRERLNHYQWVKKCGGVITGWQAQIVACSDFDGGVVVTLEIYPRQNSGATVLHDATFEKYLILDGELHHLQTTFEDGPKVTVFN